ncbi:hypothetical protein MMPV_000509 [Pyropia vietnamensis]
MARRRVVTALLAAMRVGVVAAAVATITLSTTIPGVGGLGGSAAAATITPVPIVPHVNGGGGNAVAGGGHGLGILPRQPLNRDRAVDVARLREPTPRGRVINGRVVGPRELGAGAQFMAKLFLPGGTRFYCAGSLLSYRTVLTAAHCFTGGTSIPINAVGDEVRVGGLGILEGFVSMIENVDIHPTFDIASYIGDIAIVTIANTFTPEQAVRAGVYPAKLGTEGMFDFNTALSLSGWGVTNVNVREQVEAIAAEEARKAAAEAAAKEPDSDSDSGSDTDLNSGSDTDTDSDSDSYKESYHKAYGGAAVHDRERTATGTARGSSATSAAASLSSATRHTAMASSPDRPLPVMLRQVGGGQDNGTSAAGPTPSPMLASPNTLLTTTVFARPMAECVVFAQRVIGVSEFATSLYDEEREVCLSLMDNVGACSGDSGSPFFTQLKHPNGFHSYFVHAVMSFSYPSPTEDCPAYFPDWGTRVSYYTDWINARVIY